MGKWGSIAEAHRAPTNSGSSARGPTEIYRLGLSNSDASFANRSQLFPPKRMSARARSHSSAHDLCASFQLRPVFSLGFPCCSSSTSGQTEEHEFIIYLQNGRNRGHLGGTDFAFSVYLYCFYARLAQRCLASLVAGGLMIPGTLWHVTTGRVCRKAATNWSVVADGRTKSNSSRPF